MPSETFSFTELTDKAKQRACRDYNKGWKETHPKKEDALSKEDIISILTYDLTDDRYTKFGRAIND